MKKFILILLIILLAFCYYGYENKANNRAISLEKSTLKYRIETQENLISEDKTSNTPSETISESDLTKYLETINEEIETISFKDKLTNHDKSTLKNTFVTLTDFIFYDGKIKGKTFSELTLETKQKVLTIYENIDQKIETAYPGYKEKIKKFSTKTWQSFEEKLSETKEQLITSYKDQIGEEKYHEQVETFSENYQTMKESFQPVINKKIAKTKKTYENTKEYLNNRYQTWKEENV